jgi:hypothetical protein
VGWYTHLISVARFLLSNHNKKLFYQHSTLFAFLEAPHGCGATPPIKSLCSVKSKPHPTCLPTGKHLGGFDRETGRSAAF